MGVKIPSPSVTETTDTGLDQREASNDHPNAPLEIVQDVRFQQHVAPAGHPERPERLDAVSSAIDRYAPRLERLTPRPAQPEEVLRVHDGAHLRRLAEAVKQAPGRLDADTYVSTASNDIAWLAAGSCIELARRVARRDARYGVAAVRPPGHHAEADRAMGFCLLNNVAICARALQADEGAGKLLVLDWDVHHGNGTQHIFEDDPSILYLSTHQFPHYPGTGSFDEHGHGAGEGATLNLPLPAGCGDAEYLGVLQRVLVPVARAFAPEMILVSCGFDAHRDDPLASMELTYDGYLEMTRLVRALADDLCGGRVVFVLEGGYAASGLIDGTSALLEALLEDSAQASVVPSPSSAGARVLEHVVAAAAAVHGARYAGIS
jgi:acetoin utilization deacetylase AcuC-like enzyme